jgi:hypothetical protein
MHSILVVLAHSYRDAVEESDGRHMNGGCTSEGGKPGFEHDKDAWNDGDPYMSGALVFVRDTTIHMSASYIFCTSLASSYARFVVEFSSDRSVP